MRYLALALGIGSAFAQTPSAAITAPGSGTPTVNADAGQIHYALTSTCLSCGNIAAAVYYLDGSASFPGSGELLGISRKPPYSFTWNPYYASNGGHTIYVDYLGQTDNVVATSPTVSFYVENNLPQNTCPPNGSACSDISVAPGLVVEMGTGTDLDYSMNVISFYSTSGTPAMVGGGPCNQTATGSVNCGSTTAGHTIASYERWQSATGTLSCTVTNGGTVAYGTAAQNTAGGFTGQWVYVYDIGGGTSTTLTCTNSTGSTFKGSIAFEISGVVTTNPLDVNVVCTQTTCPVGNSNPIISSPIAFGYPTANEILFAGGAYGGTLTATPGPGWTNIWNENNGMAVEEINPPGAFFGAEQLVATANGGHSAVSKTFTAFVDGTEINQTSASTAATASFIVNLTQFLSGPRLVVVRADGNNCPGCMNASWTDMGGWEQTQTFANAVVPSQLLVSGREIIMAVNGAPVTVTGTHLYTDGVTTAPAAITCVADPSPPLGVSYFTVANSGGNCIITPTSSAGIDFATATDAYGMSRVFWPYVLNSGESLIAEFGSDGQIHQGYVANAIWLATQFYSGDPLGPPGGSGSFTTSSANRTALVAASFAAAGFTGVEWGLEVPGSSQSTFQANIATDIMTVGGNLSTYGAGRLKYVHLIETSYVAGTPDLFSTVYGAAASWTPPALQNATQLWVNSGLVIGSNQCDECNWGSNPLEGTNTNGILIGTNGFTQITGNGTTCLIDWTYPLSDMFTGADRFILTGTGTALDYNGATNSPVFLYSGSITGGVITFSCSYTGTITSGTAQINPYVANTFTALPAETPCSSTSGVIPPDPPCTQWIEYNALLQVHTWITNVTNYPPISWSLANNGAPYGRTNYSGQVAVGGVRIGNFWEPYWTPGGLYLPIHHALSFMIAALGDTLRESFNTMQRTTPVISESSGTMVDYLFQGYKIAVTSCEGNTVTTATPHLVQNVIPDATKVWISGSSGSACDGNYYIVAAPTAYTLLVVQANASFALASTNVGGTITFCPNAQYPTSPCSGASYTVTTFSAQTSGNKPGLFADTLYGACPNTVKNNRGLAFTVSGSSNASINAMAGWFDSGYTTNACEANVVGAYQWWRQIPNLSSSGGTATIVPDLWYHRGISWPTNSDSGPVQMFASVNEIAIEGGSGHRAYTWQTDPQGSDLTLIGPGSAWVGPDTLGNVQQFRNLDFNNAVQAGLNSVNDFARSAEATQGHTNPNLLHARLMKYEYQTRLNSPDYGPFFEAAARTGSYGNILMIQSFVDDSITCTANLAPYLISGQPIIRFAMTWDSIQAVDVIAAGATTDSKTCAPGEFRAYLFPNNAAAELNQPAISAKLSDVTNAASILVRYSYSPLSFRSPSVAAQTLYQVYNCGTGSCQLPVDKQIGTIYYELVYLNSSGRVLATSDVQTL